MATTTIESLVRIQERYAPPAFDGTPFTRDNWTNWILDSLIFGFTALAEGRPHEAMRGLILANRYVGRVGGFWPNPCAHDAAIKLQNALEDMLLSTERAS